MDAALVLVHSPLVGPTTWRPTADVLRAGGATVLVPDLTPPVDAARPWWRTAANEVVAATADLPAERPLVAVGHSAAGPRVPAIARALEEAGHPVSAHVLVDAGMPHAGRVPAEALPPEFVAHLDALVRPDGLLPPWPDWWPPELLADLVPDAELRAAIAGECSPTPRDLYDEPVPVPDGWPGSTPCGYLSFTYEDDAVEAERRGWTVVRADGNHLRPAIDPDGVAALLHSLIDGLCP
jgi:hypothetical protein